MTLKRRILIANLTMVLIPVLATAFVAGLCAFAIWHSLSLGQGFDDTSDLREAALAATAVANHAYTADDTTPRAERLDKLAGVLDKTGLALEVTRAETGEVVDTFGDTAASDAGLRDASRALGTGSLVEQGGHALFVTSLDVAGETYDLTFSGAIRTSASYTHLKASIVAAAALVLLTVLASSVFTSRVVSRILVRHFQDELARASEQLERRDAARRQLVADISHDLRSPLTSIRGYAEGLLDGVATTPERQRHYLEIIRDKSVEVSDLAEHVFSYSKLELDDYPTQLQELRVDELAREVALEVEGNHEGHLELELHLEETTARADATLLRRALANVLENSVKYRRGEAAHVRLSVRTHQDAACVEVADDGVGLASPADADRIFEPFFRTDAARERPQEGSGLGLAFVRRALQLMGGAASARPVEPHGLAVTLSIPLTPGKEATCGTHPDH